MADAFLFDLYDRAQFHIKSGNGNLNMGMISSLGGESRNYGVSWQTPYTQVLDVDYNENGLLGKIIDYYDYALIRECNQMITRLPLSNNLNKNFIDTRVSEARFIRAHAYFEMVKRFGGVPLVTDVIPVQKEGSHRIHGVGFYNRYSCPRHWFVPPTNLCHRRTPLGRVILRCH